MSNESFISVAEFNTALRHTGWTPGERLAVAVSGGGDSLALALLLKECGADIVALTVDHGLRSESAAEAKTVHDILAAKGIAHETLTWRGDKPSTHIQERAREARYDLLLGYCKAQGIGTLALAHNLEDQAETFWMRLGKGSGVDGLAGMAPARNVGGITMIRPVMGFTRARLRATCEHFGVRWIDDPSNTNDKYLRVKLRAFEEMLAGEGFTPERLALVMQKLGDAAAALQAMTDGALKDCLTLNPEGYATLKLDGWRPLPREIQRRVIGHVLDTLVPQEYRAEKGARYPIGFDQLETARLELMDESFKGKTLAGCEFTRGKNNTVLILRQLWNPQAQGITRAG